MKRIILLGKCFFVLIILSSIFTGCASKMVCVGGDCQNGQGVSEVGMETYEGQWKDGKWNGQGKYTIGQSVYVGQFKDGKYDGNGTFIGMYNGEFLGKADGQWKAGLKDGQCTVKYPNGDLYTGQFKSDARDGNGTYTWANGNVYIGEWSNDIQVGQGTYTWANGDVYVGEWQDNMRYGKGKLKATYEGVTMVIEGRWKNNEYLGK